MTIILSICDVVPSGTVVVDLAVMDTSTNLAFLEWTLGFNGVVAFAVLYMNMWWIKSLTLCACWALGF